MNKSLKELNEVTEVAPRANMMFEIPDLELDARNSLAPQQSIPRQQENHIDLKDEVKSEVISQPKSQKWGKEEESADSEIPDDLFDVDF